MDNNSMDFSNKQISTRRTDVDANRSIAEYRSMRDRDIKDLGNSFDSINRKLEERLKYLDSIEKKTSAQISLENELNRIKSKTEDMIKNNNIEYADALDLQKESVSLLEKAAKAQEKLEISLAKSEKSRQQIRNRFNDQLEELNYMSGEIARHTDTHKKANQSKLDEFSRNLTTFREQIRDLAIVTGMSSIDNRLKSYNNVQSMYGSGSFNSMQSTAMSNLMNNYGAFDTLTRFNYNDMLDYMGRLEQIGISNLDLARQQADDIMFGAKYLGMSVETQNKIYKLSRDTGKMDLLTDANQTMVQLMNAQLGISKTHLEASLKQGTDMADLVNFYSKDSDNMTKLTQGLTAIEKMYGEDSRNAVNSIAERILNNDTSLLQYMPNFYGIQGRLASGDATALNEIVESVKNSSMINAMSNAKGTLGLPDKDLRTLFTARNQTNGTFEGWMQVESQASKDTNKYLESMKESATKMIENFISWTNKWLPIEAYQAVYYPLAIAQILSDFFPSIKGFIKGINGKISDLFGSVKDIGGTLGSASGGLGGAGTGLLGSVGTIASVVSLIAGTIWAIKDGVDGLNKKEEWGTSGGASFLGGMLGGTDANETTRMLKNGVKGMLIGAGIGGIIGACFAGVGAVPGAIIGGILGLAIGAGLGAIGGQNIASGIDSFLGTSPENAGGVNTAPVTNLSNARGGSVAYANYGQSGNARGNFRWAITSPFGYRGSIETSAGYTNPFHNGIDLASSSGTPIGANNAGIVSAVGTDGSRGNYAIINSGDGYEQVYYHMLQPSHLVKGQGINAGQLVGLMGSTGMSTGTHLHFGMRKAGTNDYVDPQPYVNYELWNVSDRGVPGLGVMSMGLYGDDKEEDELRSSTLIAKTVDANTLSTEVAGGMGGEGIIKSVDDGFSSLIAKLDELSQRQDAQEEMLSILAGSGSTQLLKY